MPESKVLSDFHLNFWTAGYLVAHNQVGSIYPDYNATTPVGTKFNEIVHQLFPTLPPERYGVFLYLPLMAVLCAPFSLLPAHLGLLLWQLVNIAGLTAFSLVSARETSAKWWQIFLLAFLYLPVFSTLWIGQCSILVGLLPLALGFYFARKEQDFLAGIAWSAMIIKPQYATIPLLTAIATKRWTMLAGLLVGCGAILIASYFCLSPEVFQRWLHAVSQIGETAITGNIAVPSSLVASVPGCILVSIPPNARAQVKWAIYGATTLVSLLALSVVLFKAGRKFEREEYLSVALMVNILFLPLYSRLLNYDLVLFILAALICLAQLARVEPSKEFDGFRREVQKFAIAVGVAVDLQVICATFLPQSNLALPFALVLMGTTVWMSRIVIRACWLSTRG